MAKRTPGDTRISFSLFGGFRNALNFRSCHPFVVTGRTTLCLKNIISVVSRLDAGEIAPANNGGKTDG